MITDYLSNAPLYYPVHRHFELAFDFLMRDNLGNLAPGKYPLIDTDVFALVMAYQTKDPAEAPLECHRTYIDIQYIISGTERMGYAALAPSATLSYNAEKDVAIFPGQCDYLIMPRGSFAIFFPQDAHQPQIMVDKPEAVQKVVVKVKI